MARILSRLVAPALLLAAAAAALLREGPPDVGLGVIVGSARLWLPPGAIWLLLAAPALAWLASARLLPAWTCPLLVALAAAPAGFAADALRLLEPRCQHLELAIGGGRLGFSKSEWQCE